jgi:hypothetical protein
MDPMDRYERSSGFHTPTIKGGARCQRLHPSDPSRLALRHILHSKYDSKELTQPARDKFNQRFLDQVDPERVLPEAERQRRAEQARKAYFTRLALKSAVARRKAK